LASALRVEGVRALEPLSQEDIRAGERRAENLRKNRELDRRCRACECRLRSTNKGTASTDDGRPMCDNCAERWSKDPANSGKSLMEPAPRYVPKWLRAVGASVGKGAGVRAGQEFVPGLRREMGIAGKSETELANAIKKPVKQIEKYAATETRPEESTARAIADVLGCSLEDLREGGE
jgi:ribosome-binding protein aMBF1 (putative translation factor)